MRWCRACSLACSAPCSSAHTGQVCQFVDGVSVIPMDGVVLPALTTYVVATSCARWRRRLPALRMTSSQSWPAARDVYLSAGLSNAQCLSTHVEVYGLCLEDGLSWELWWCFWQASGSICAACEVFVCATCLHKPLLLVAAASKLWRVLAATPAWCFAISGIRRHA